VFADRSLAGTPDDLSWLLMQNDRHVLPALWVGCGTEDRLYAHNLRFVETCATNGVPVTSSFVPGEHEWGLWDEQIQDVLAWLPLQSPPAPSVPTTR
jgi:S-formylglutathione hydrolase FrmB